MAESVVAICNAALDLLGAETIQSLDDQRKEAKVCNRRYPAVRDAVLRAHPWNCALIRKAIPADADPPVWGWGKAFTLPADPYCLRVLAVEDYSTGNRFEIEGRKIVTDLGAPLNVLFIARVIDPTLFDDLLAEAIAARLAADIAYSITGSGNIATQMWQLYTDKLREARGVDGKEGIPVDDRSMSWLAARN